MRLEILRSLAAPLPDFREGDVRDVEDELAESLVKRGLAANTDKELTPLDKKTGQRKGVEAATRFEANPLARHPAVPAVPPAPRAETVDTDAPGGGTSLEATQPQPSDEHSFRGRKGK